MERPGDTSNEQEITHDLDAASEPDCCLALNTAVCWPGPAIDRHQAVGSPLPVGRDVLQDRIWYPQQAEQPHRCQRSIGLTDHPRPVSAGRTLQQALLIDGNDRTRRLGASLLYDDFRSQRRCRA